MSIDWAAVYTETYESLVRCLHRMVWDLDRAQDIAQEAFARGLDEEPENPRAWVFRVALNLAKDEARTAVRRKKHLVLIKGEAEATQEQVPDAAEQYEHQERLDDEESEPWILGPAASAVKWWGSADRGDPPVEG